MTCDLAIFHHFDEAQLSAICKVESLRFDADRKLAEARNLSFNSYPPQSPLSDKSAGLSAGRGDFINEDAA